MKLAVVGLFVLLCLLMLGGALWMIRRLMGSFQEALGTEGSLDHAAQRLDRAGIDHQRAGDSTLSFDRAGTLILLTTQRHREAPWYTPRTTHGHPVPRTFAHFALRAPTGLQGVVTNDNLYFSKHARTSLGWTAQRSLDIPDHAHFRQLNLFAGDDERLHALHAAIARTMSEWSALSNLLHASRLYCHMEPDRVTLSIERNLNVNSSALPLVQRLIKVMKRPPLEPEELITTVLTLLGRLLPPSQPAHARPTT